MGELYIPNTDSGLLHLKKNCVLQKEVNEMKHWSMEKEFIIQKYKSILTQFCK